MLKIFIMIRKIRAGIIGGAGYTGGELIRLLINHPHAEISFVNSKSNAGKYLYQVHEDLAGETDQKFSTSPTEEVDLLFLCAGHGEAKKYLQENQIAGRIKMIDLSQDFRLHPGNTSGDRNFIYGLPELNKEEIKICPKYCQPGLFCHRHSIGFITLGKGRFIKRCVYHRDHRLHGCRTGSVHLHPFFLEGK